MSRYGIDTAQSSRCNVIPCQRFETCCYWIKVWMCWSCINIFFFCVSVCLAHVISVQKIPLTLMTANYLSQSTLRSFNHVTTKPDWASIVWRRSLCAIKDIVPRCEACIHSFVYHTIFSLPFSFVFNLEFDCTAARSDRSRITKRFLWTPIQSKAWL